LWGARVVVLCPSAFLQGLEQSGWIDGRNVRVDHRWGAGNAELYRRYAAELVALSPDVILTSGTASLTALRQAAGIMPIVFAGVTDPVGAGDIDSLARPGGNITGFTMFEYGIGGKWLDLLKQIAPEVKRVAVIRDPGITAGVGQFAVSNRSRPRSVWMLAP
jgi:putative ABC transport system substrate-binding protein